MNIHRCPVGWSACAAVILLLSDLSGSEVTKLKDPNVPEGEVLQLSPFEVIALSSQFNHWIKVGSKHFVIYSDESPKMLRRLLWQMESLHESLLHLMHREDLNLPPMVFILPNTDSDWSKLMLKGTDLSWQTIAHYGSHRDAGRLAVIRAEMMEEFSGLFLPLIDDELFCLFPGGQEWFYNGMNRYFATVDFQDDAVVLGKIDPRWKYTLGIVGWKPWEEIFGNRDEEENDIGFDAQSMLLVHYLISSGDPQAMTHVLDLVSRLDTERPTSEESFVSIFGIEWKKLRATLVTHAETRHYFRSQMSLAQSLKDFQMTEYPLKSAEMRELFVLVRITIQHSPDSEHSLDNLLARGLKNTAFGELLVAACERHKRPDEVLNQLRRIIKQGSTNPLVFASASAALFQRQLPQMTVDSRLDKESAAEIKAWCQRALEIEPLLLETDNRLAWAEALGPEIGQQELVDMATIYRRLHAANLSTGSVLGAMAVARWRAGDTAGVKELCQTLRESPYTPATVLVMAEALQGKLAAAH